MVGPSPRGSEQWTVVQSRVSSDELRAERQGALVTAATELFIQRGFHQTSVRDIASAAGMTMGTLYSYISRKEDVLYLIARAITTELWEGIPEPHPDETALETLSRIAQSLFAGVGRMRREVGLIYRETASLPPEYRESAKQHERGQRERIAAVVRRGIERGEFREVQPDLVAQNLILLAHMWALKGWALKDSFDIRSYTDQQLDLFFAGLVVRDVRKP